MEGINKSHGEAYSEGRSGGLHDILHSDGSLKRGHPPMPKKAGYKRMTRRLGLTHRGKTPTDDRGSSLQR